MDSPAYGHQRAARLAGHLPDALRLADGPDKTAYMREVKERGLDGNIDSSLAVSDLGLEASRMALKHAGLGAEDLDCVVESSTLPELAFPGTGCVLQGKLNFQRGAVYHKGAFAKAARNLAQFVWAIGKKAVTGFRLEWPDLLARSGADMPAGFFSVAPLERFIREAFAGKGLPNNFRECRRPLLIPAIDLDRAERVVFGAEPFLDVPISEAIAASSAIPGFFEPFPIGGRDYVDGDVGYTGHADLAVAHSATRVVMLNPAVPLRIGSPDEPDVRSRGLYAIMEQTGHITSINILQLGLRELKLRRPDVEIHLVQPESIGSPLRGPSMGFEASRAALRYGYSSVTDWLSRDGAAFAAAFR